MTNDAGAGQVFVKRLVLLSLRFLTVTCADMCETCRVLARNHASKHFLVSCEQQPQLLVSFDPVAHSQSMRGLSMADPITGHLLAYAPLDESLSAISCVVGQSQKRPSLQGSGISCQAAKPESEQ